MRFIAAENSAAKTPLMVSAPHFSVTRRMFARIGHAVSHHPEETDMNQHQNKTIRSSLSRLAASAALVIGVSVTGIVATSLALSGAASAAFITADPSLPPDGVYRTIEEEHARYIVLGVPIELLEIRHFGFTNIVHTPQGPDERETFDSTMTGLVRIGGGAPFSVTLTGPVETIVFGKIGNITGTFDTEMLQLDLTGGGIIVRESPTLASLGETTIEDIGGGLFAIHSFFDVFTELSLDGGATFTTSTGSARAQLVPEPGSLALLAAGLALLGWGKRRNRR